VEQRFRAHAQADRLHALDVQVIEQREHVESSLAKRERARRVRGAPISAQVGHDDSEAVRIAASEDDLLIAAAAGAAVQEQ
jgi:hypothetical protein